MSTEKDKIKPRGNEAKIYLCLNYTIFSDKEPDTQLDSRVSIEIIKK